MKRQILKEYVKLRKLPKFIHLGNIPNKLCNYYISISDKLENTNERNIEYRKELGLVYDTINSPIGQTYETKHKDDLDVYSINCISEFKETFNWRFGVLKSFAEIPEHLDTHKSLRFLIILSGNCNYIAEGHKTLMNKGDVYFINTGYRHKVMNGSTDRIALLGEMNNNEQNIKLLRARS